SSSQVAHTLTACTRCRSRKTRCDPGLPRCSSCVKTNSTCEYYDANKGHNVNRSYVVHLQKKVRELEQELEKLENDDGQDDPEAMMRSATVRVHDAQESKYLGPSSGIAITRLVMQLAKQFTDSKSIKDIVPDARAKQIKELNNQEEAKPTSKSYPLVSNVAAEVLPARGLTDLLVKLYKLKVQPMYPALHEPTLDRDVDIVFDHGDSATPFQNFVTRMVIAISLQKMNSQYAGLADSYYLAALNYMEPVVKPMDLGTLQCFALIAEYSLLTPTRTAIYYVVGIAVRLAQALGFNEEKTISRPGPDGRIDLLEIDMRRRVFWCVWVMDCGLAHSLGRPAILATSDEHLDVKWFETCDDNYITPDGVDPTAPRPNLKKWIAIHFFKMRRLQLEIRRKLYLKKRSRPETDDDPWFIQMEARLNSWRDASPSQDEGMGLDKKWFIGRYNTMIVFLYRPSPQIPRPSVKAALKCFAACEYNVHLQRDQIDQGNIDMTWIFTQSIFMAINTMLWSLSYVEVRKQHSRTDVLKHLRVAMEAIGLASERWPGVASAIQLYDNLIAAVLRIYEKDGDVPIAAGTPSDVASPMFAESTRSRGTSPATVASSSVATPDQYPLASMAPLNHSARRSVEHPPPIPYGSSDVTSAPSPPSQTMLPRGSAPNQMQQAPGGDPTIQQRPSNPFSEPLPDFPLDFNNVNWNSFSIPPVTFASNPAVQSSPFFNSNSSQSTGPLQTPFGGYPGSDTMSSFDPSTASYPFPHGTGNDSFASEPLMPQYWQMDQAVFGNGLDQFQQQELLHDLEADSGMQGIESMISATVAAMGPKPQQ
ncbi:hypothetical protein K431DRAFT_189383, partial [Polychaeton citri CBS 116435]